jgi:chromosome segregation ATPase
LCANDEISELKQHNKVLLSIVQQFDQMLTTERARSSNLGRQIVDLEARADKFKQKRYGELFVLVVQYKILLKQDTELRKAYANLQRRSRELEVALREERVHFMELQLDTQAKESKRMLLKEEIAKLEDQVKEICEYCDALKRNCDLRGVKQANSNPSFNNNETDVVLTSIRRGIRGEPRSEQLCGLRQQVLRGLSLKERL